jgi:asparagine synthase (glutamine-hydrolysing)
MCGIAGLFHPRTAGVSIEEAPRIVGEMLRTLVHRGPDAEGIWSDPGGRAVLGNRRLSVIDVSEAGHQPMVSFDGRWVIAFNGEIYNFDELRPLLSDAGVSFRGHSDTEVLVNSIALWDVGALSKLDGMFGFAAFDTLTGEILLARDPFGEKPLYYMELPGGGLAFASELCAMESLPFFDGTVSVEAMAELLMFQYIGAPRSIYQSIRKLPPGHWLRAAPGGPPKLQRYFSFQPGLADFDSRPVQELADELEEILVRSIRRRMIADVPFGAFLSGGVDSSTVCALIRKRLGMPLKTFSIGFGGAPESEHGIARSFAEHLGTEHRERVLTPDSTEVLSDLGGMLDEPNADWSCLPVYMLSSFAREQVTVAISGDGGDEMFGGYDRYFEALEKEREQSPGSGSAWKAGDSYYEQGLLTMGENGIAELFGAVPPALAAHLRLLREEINRPPPPLLCRLRRTDVENYLPGAVLAKVDRMSMQHSLEVRTPFLSVDLARFAERLPPGALYRPGTGKLVLREVARRYLPRELIDQPKYGFGLPTEWAGSRIRGVARRLLGNEESRLRAFFGAGVLDAMLTDPQDTVRWWALSILESWFRHHPAKLPPISRPVVID